MERKVRLPRRWQLLLGALLLSAIGGYWWWQHPSPLRYLASNALQVTDSAYLTPFTRGFVFQETPDTYAVDIRVSGGTACTNAALC